ncbi:uncharacterized protein LOC120075715 [Benincasa hispida]|uniref:uncharacterized protein LOC120075715 n=1 Tax=Benincasa hispida TaxID=102211 RepID=UPI0018FF34F9|nr:uncharacterized protein LOC120075715 [Benincasa hispida]XP_038885270.1 uncharacterized protein LOC120075715 [Benincasa hispida]
MTTSTTNVVHDALSKILGPDHGHVRGFGFGGTRTKLSLLSQQDNKYKVLEKKYIKIEEMIEMKAIMSCFIKKQVEPSEELSNAIASVPKATNIPSTFLISSPLLEYGLMYQKKPDAYLWRPTSEMTCIEEALDSTAA